MKRIHPKWFLCAFLALAGAFLFFCLPGYKFAGLALMGLSALIPVYHFLRHDFLRRVLTALLALGFVGGMERELIAVGKGAALAMSCEIVGAALLWKGGVIRVR